MHRERGNLYIILHQVYDTRLHGVLGGFVRIVHAQFAEDVLAMAVHGVETQVPFGGYLFGRFTQSNFF